MKWLITILIIIIVSDITAAVELQGGDLIMNIELDQGDTIYSNTFTYHVVQQQYYFASISINFAPSVTITSPNHGDIVNESFYINWTTLDVNGDNYLTNITLNNGTVIASNLPKTTVNFLWNSSYADGIYEITVTSCENETAERLCGVSTIRVFLNNLTTQSEFIAIALLYGTITIIGALSIYLFNNPLVKLAATGLTSLMATTDLFISKLIVEIISPSSSGFITVLENIYMLSMWTTVFIMMGMIVYCFYRVIVYMRELPINQRQNRVKSFGRKQ